MKKIYRVFLDTSVIFSAVYSETGGARKLFRLGEAGAIQLLVGPTVLQEAESVLRRKAPATLPKLAIFMELGGVAVVEKAAPVMLETARKLVSYEPDAFVLAEALGAGPDWFATHDQAHFLKPLGEIDLPFRPGTPGDVIQALADAFTDPA